MQHVKTAVAAVLVLLSASVAAAQSGDARKAAEAAMMKADRDFNQASVDRNIDRFLARISETAAFDSADGRGREAIRKAWGAFFEKDGPTITWSPKKAEALAAGDVGYTVGAWERHAKDASGKDVVRRGEYLTVWKKEKDGVWRATFDTGSTRP